VTVLSLITDTSKAVTVSTVSPLSPLYYRGINRWQVMTRPLETKRFTGSRWRQVLGGSTSGPRSGGSVNVAAFLASPFFSLNSPACMTNAHSPSRSLTNAHSPSRSRAWVSMLRLCCICAASVLCLCCVCAVSMLRLCCVSALSLRVCA
jgi:hypothetical protein